MIINKLLGGFIKGAKVAGQAKKAFDEVSAKIEAFNDDLADENKIAEKDEILTELQALKEDIPPTVERQYECPLGVAQSHYPKMSAGF
ncbi:MAG: hypothetical protein K2X77_18600 [Candidatus Obscuribacterales bacterium]|nr:hypothetical protein [Candidatus Obscuribacterales bacterium]